MDDSLENNPKYPYNSADPAGIAHRLKVETQPIKEQIRKVQTLCNQLYEEVNKLSNMSITVNIEHGKYPED